MPEQVEASLYQGEVCLRMDKNHRYTITDNGDSFHCPSVTTILNVLNKPALVEWGVKCACNYMDERLKEIFSKEDFTVESIFQAVNEAREAHNRVKQEAADIGTDAHDWLAQYWLAKLDLAPAPAALEEGPVQNCITAALDWVKQHEVTPVAIEQPLYSRIHRITGTADFFGNVDGSFSIIDYKSTKAIYPELCLQVTAYSSFYEEEHKKKVFNRYGLRMDKATGKFEDKKYPNESFDEDMNSFICAFKLYDRLKYLRRKPKKDWIDCL